MKKDVKSAKKRVLLVDDDKDFVESNKTLLETEGYEVLTAYDGAAGLELATRERPDILVMDVMMSTDTEGFDVSRKIPQIPELKDMPVILVTGVRSVLRIPLNVKPDKSWLPVTGILEKPVPPQMLLSEIRKRLG